VPLLRYIALVLPRTSRLSVPIPVIASVVAAFFACGRTSLDGPLSGGAAGRATGVAGHGAAGHGGSGGFATGGFATGGFATGGFATGGFAADGFAGFGDSVAGGFAGFSDLAGADGFAGGGAGGGDTGGAGGFAGTFGFGGAGGVSGCVDGVNDCADPLTARICFAGEPMTFACTFGCFNGVCNECVPGTSTCSSDDEVQACSPTGILQPPQPCGTACSNGACMGCTEGDTRCSSVTTQQTCKGGKWTGDGDCPFVCFGKTCGTKPRHVFVTSQAVVAGNLGGLPGADDTCRSLASNAGLSSSYSAWLSDDTGSPSVRFPQDVGPYLLLDGTIVANNWQDLTSGLLRHAIDHDEMGRPLSTAVGNIEPFMVFTDTTASGTLSTFSKVGGSCNDWSDPMGTEIVIGTTQDADSQWTEWGSVGSGVAMTPAICSQSAALYCFEQ
jgi:hypothetical protein